MTSLNETSEWEDLDIESARPAERLREQRVQPVPAAIVRLAQKARDGVPHATREGEKVHVLEYGMPLKRAKEFQRHMKNAGLHVTPVATISCHIEPPDAEGDETPVTVRWRASNRKGAKPA